MKVKVMVTNGGPHPPEKWSEQTAEQLVDVIQVEPTYPNYEAALQQKNVLKDKFMAALTPHHTKVQGKERGHLSTKGSEHLASDLDPNEYLDEAVAAVNAAVKGSMFEEHFAKPLVQIFIKSTLAGHFASAMHIERSWHADRNPDDQHARAYRAQHSAGV